MVVMFVMCFVGFTVIGLALYAVGRDRHMLTAHTRRLSDEVRDLHMLVRDLLGEFDALEDALTSDVEGVNVRIDDLRTYCDTRFARSRAKRGSKLFPEIPPPPPSPKLDNGSPYEQLTLQLDDSDDDTLRPEDN